MLCLSQSLSGAGYDLVIYGGTSAGIAAAVQAERMGATVVLIEPTKRIGGLTTGGLGQTDIGNKHVVGGISREFYQMVRQWYSKPDSWKWSPMPGGSVGTGQSQTHPDEDTQWTFEPNAALAIYENWIRANNIPVVYGERLDRTGEGRAVDRNDGWWIAKPGSVAKGVIKEGNRITAIIMESGRRFDGRMFMDATYEGDLMASAGVSFTIGREGQTIHGETLNGVQTERARSHQLKPGIDPYIKKGDPASGLLPGIDPTGPGKETGSDHRIQAYCFRMCLTDVPANRLPFAKPDGYDESCYEILFRNYEAGFGEMPWLNARMPNGKTDTNNRRGFSTDFIGQNYGWPQGSYSERDAIRKAHLRYQQGLMWTLANHPRIPEKIRKETKRWGMTRDEFVDGGGWQEQLYVREGRRMISDVVMTELHCRRKEKIADPVGMAAYSMDSHNVQRYVTESGHVKNEGDVQSGVHPYPISYRSIIPKKKECDNLVVPVALSASHIAFGSIRMEPVFMILGQSGATAAMQAMTSGKGLQEIDYARLRERLLADGQILEPKSDDRVKVSEVTGIVMDEKAAKLTGKWFPGNFRSGVAEGYIHDNNARNGKASAEFVFCAPEQGRYSVQVAFLPNPNRSTQTLVRIGDTKVHINQREQPTVDKIWLPVTEVALSKNESLPVVISNEGANGYVVVDAVRLLPLR
ncbi:FAD-dependent oxidoreductase [Opitutaceae bacterium TAV4]|nr:FAD-dependent oxidoreductase [Opitutaceae bacterium TAV4]RRK01037.1 FAD-dependent oxidoreductase [Opitutaceae bacterium TAV3]